MATKVLFLSMAVALIGCQQAPVGASRQPAIVRPGLVMVPVDQLHHYGYRSAKNCDMPTEYAATDTRSVQSEGTISAIQFNRYADPAQPQQLMHEAHVVYRRETAPRWKLRPTTAKQQILVGPQITDGRGEIQPLVTQELETFLNEQRTHQQRQQQVIAGVSEGIRQLALQQQQLANEVAQLKSGRTTESPDNSAPRESAPSAHADSPERTMSEPEKRATGG